MPPPPPRCAAPACCRVKVYSGGHVNKEFCVFAAFCLRHPVRARLPAEAGNPLCRSPGRSCLCAVF